MLTKRFDQLPAVTSLTGAEIVPVMRSGVTSRTTVAALNSQTAEKVSIFYGPPQGVNGLYDTDYAAGLFGTYDSVVFGADLDDTGNAYHASTVDIITRIPHVTVFGYLDISTTFANYSMATMKAKMLAWAGMGARGMFFDVAGYAFGVSRARINECTDHAHSLGMVVCANDFAPDDLFGTTVDPVHNPSGAPTTLRAGDLYLLESWVANTVAYTANDGWATMFDLKGRAEKATAYRASLGIKLWSTGIVDYSSYTTERTDDYWAVHEALSLAYGLDGYGFAPPDYSATGATANAIRTFPYRPQAHRPAGAPHFDAPWTTVTSPGTGQEIHYALGATPVYDVTEYRGR